MDRETLKKIIEDGTRGISGDNSQPWRFEAEGASLDIFNLPERDNPILNVRQRGSYVAHGSLIENIVISAKQYGYAASVALFPDTGKKNLTARLIFTKTGAGKDQLSDYIKKRATNRKPYEKRPLKPEDKKELLEAAGSVGGGELKFVEDNESKIKIGKALSVTEQVALTTKELHFLFFKDMVWTEKEEREKKHGLYIKTLELPPPVEWFFRLIKHWKVIRVLNFLGFYKLAAAGNAKIYSSAGAFGAILVEDRDENFIRAGWIMQRVWLTATKLGLQMQPITGVLFLHQRVREAKEPFNEAQVEMIERAYRTLEAAFGAENGIIAMLFRVGYDGEPSARSSRMPPDIKFI